MVQSMQSNILYITNILYFSTGIYLGIKLLITSLTFDLDTYVKAIDIDVYNAVSTLRYYKLFKRLIIFITIMLSILLWPILFTIVIFKNNIGNK